MKSVGLPPGALLEKPTLPMVMSSGCAFFSVDFLTTIVVMM
jgi:hypothetical protein